MPDEFPSRDPDGSEGRNRADLLFEAASAGDDRAFEAWLVEVEESIRRSLFQFALAVDLESVIQETLHRMWEHARDPETRLHGRNASLRFAIRMARNVARNEGRRFGRETFLPPEELPDIPVEQPPPSDPALARLIRLCLERLPGRPRQALDARIEEGHREDDRTLAARLGMTLNTFLQNVVRGRRHLEACLEEHGAPLDEVFP